VFTFYLLVFKSRLSFVSRLAHLLLRCVYPVCFVCTEAVVQFDYAAREPDELTLKKGDVITDVKPMPDGWMEGHKDGKKGMFPDNYVKVPTLKLFIRTQNPELRSN